MSRISLRTIVFLTIAPFTIVAWSDAASQASLFEAHRWFDLRNALRNSQDPSRLYLGAVASAFHDDARAVLDLDAVINAAPKSEEAFQAHRILFQIDARSGRHRDAAKELDAMLGLKPESKDIAGTVAVFGAWRTHPNQIAVAPPSTSFSADVTKDGVSLPVTIYGKTVHWLFDTGSDFTIVSESEARSLGVAIDDAAGGLTDSAGGETHTRTAVIDEMSIGKLRLQNVACLVIPDSQEPMADWQPGHRGVIGLPVAIAMGIIEWKSDGTVTVRSGKTDLSNNPNLAFDALGVSTRADSVRGPLDFVLDTGNQSGTQLWTRFGADFSSLIATDGKKSSNRVDMVGGSNLRDTIALPEIMLRVGGLEVALRPATVYSKPVGDDYHHGLLGMDILSQATYVRIDFRAMTLTLQR